ncbi:OLC1v1003690C1 [Oldenlandia corymbosa var. corymbosa]|uniref:OLC1v1003690C1 n=1 Tax=Oldenlandia corymbosa var. corymbosa TaxID=529605 RepID=A0AAV1DAR7_OLDCO|nr:OLC1v1003690C1 [Oldenlandia corymbosa var. corymbosa]
MDLKPQLLVKRSESSEICTSTIGAAAAPKLSSPNSGSGSGKQIKSCSDCHTTRTPLWRGGPAGPKTLCNACGIKYNKKRRETLGLVDKNRIEKAAAKRKSRKIATTGGGGGEIGGIDKMNSEGVMPSSIRKMRVMVKERSWRKLMMMSNSKLREEEQAAVLLMALSCGSVYA